MQVDRIYLVIDMKSFFASVECAERNLDAMNTKLVVSDVTRGEGTICLAVSPKLKELGVKNRCRLHEIPKTIDFIIAKPRMRKYIEYASEIYAIYLNYIDKEDIHVYSIDESFLDVTDYLKLYNVKPKEFALQLVNEIRKKLKIPATVGIGTNLYLAKVALDITAKHSKDFVGWLNEEKFVKELWNHKPLSDFWGISTGTIERLRKYGIETMKDIAKADENLLYKEFGINAELLIDHANGKESCTMKDIKKYTKKSKSISSSQILPCDYKFSDAKIVMREMLQSGCLQLFEQEYVTKTITIKVTYAFSEFNKRVSEKGTVSMNVTTNLASIIEPEVMNIFDKIVDKQRMIRKLEYCFCNLKNLNEEQYDFFTDENKLAKEKKLTKSVIDIKNHYGKNSILKALDYKEKATQFERNCMIGGHSGGED